MGIQAQSMFGWYIWNMVIKMMDMIIHKTAICILSMLVEMIILLLTKQIYQLSNLMKKHCEMAQLEETNDSIEKTDWGDEWKINASMLAYSQ
jgi:hypothetical protein